MPRFILSASIALAALVMPAFGGEPAPAAASKAAAVSNAFDITVSGSLMSDYIYRGISLSARRPAVASSIDIQYGWFYVSGELHSVKLPANPAAEITLATGVRKKIAGIDFDLAANYFYYPGETVTETQPSDDYWQVAFAAERWFYDRFKLAGSASYSPNISHSGAWGSYVSGEIEYKLTDLSLSNGHKLEWLMSAELGHARFGTTSFGFDLPAYTHWRLGTKFKADPLRFDLSYHDTNLTKEDCFVQTGDLAATPGGSINPSSNPVGLRSGLCGRALVGTLSFEFEVSKSD